LTKFGIWLEIIAVWGMNYEALIFWGWLSPD